jgi:hypothetical protein
MMVATRRHLDQYFTPASATLELQYLIPFHESWVLECCNGDGGISKVLNTAATKTNDIDESLAADFHLDASLKSSWEQFTVGAHWVVSNPPFNQAAEIVPLAYDYAKVGIAMLLRLSFLEPTKNRGHWLNKNPPTQLIVLPRISFTGDGKTDNVTCAWMVWEKGKQGMIYVAKNAKFCASTETE